MGQKLEIQCFGELQIITGGAGESIRLPPTIKAQSLLAYLICHRQAAHPRHRLTGMFWGDHPERRARRSLSTALWHIRRCFGDDDPIMADNQKVKFNWDGEVWLDVETFAAASASTDLTHLQTAVNLYQGDFLDGFYDDWVINKRYRLQADYLDVLTRLMDGYETAVQPQVALQTALTLLQHNPLREDAHRAAMRAYLQLGRRNDALAQYAQCHRIITSELSTDPTPETVALHTAILREEITAKPISQMPAVPEFASPIQPRQHNPFSVTAVLPLIEREAILADLKSAWLAVKEKNGRFLLVQGEAGIGKTRLLSDFAAGIRQQGGQVLKGRCYEFERRLPYQPVAEALQPALNALPASDLAILPTWVTVELARLAPQKEDTYPSNEPEALFQAVVFFLAQLADTAPLLLILDDLHWANESTLAILHHLGRQCQQMPILIIAACRDVYPSEFFRWRQQLLEHDWLTFVSLTRLSHAGVKQMVAEMIGDNSQTTALATFLFQQTEGNPFFLAETFKHLVENKALVWQNGRWQITDQQLRDISLPSGIIATVATRLERLSPDTKNVIYVASILGQSFQYDHLQAVCNEDEEALLSALDDLLHLRLIAESDEVATSWDYAFTHHKIQEAVTVILPRHRRLHLHKQAAFALERHGTPTFQLATQLAYHFDQAQILDKSLTPKAVFYLKMAGEQAAAQYANAEAADYFTRALNLTSETDLDAQYALLLARERSRAMLGERESQHRDLERLVEVGHILQDDLLRAEIAVRQGRFFYVMGDFVKTIEAAHKAISWAQTGQVPDLEAKGFLLWGEACFAQGKHEDSRRYFENARLLAQNASSRKIEADSLNDLGRYFISQSNYPVAKARFEQALAIYQDLHMGSSVGEGNILANLGMIARAEGNYEIARDYFLQAKQVFHRHGDRHKEGMIIGNLGVTAWDMGATAVARSYFLESLHISREVEDRGTEGYWLHNLSRISAQLGDFSAATQHLQEALMIFRHLGERQSESMALNSIGLTLVEQGNFAEAETYFNEALQIRHETGDRRGEGYTLHYLGSLALIHTEFSKARSNHNQAFIIFREIGEQQGKALALAGLGKVAAHLGDYVSAQVYYEQALTIFQEIGSRLSEAEILAETGNLLCQQKDYKTAKEISQKGLIIAQAANAPQIQAAALTVLGHALLGLNKYTKAINTFEQAISLRQKMGQEHLTPEPLSGLARISLIQGNLTQAQAQATKLWAILKNKPSDYLPAPLDVYLTCYQIFQANTNTGAQQILGQAHTLLQKAATNIDEEHQRKAFFSIPEHREILITFTETAV